MSQAEAISTTARKAPWFKLLFKLITTRLEDRIDILKLAIGVGDIVRIPGKRHTFIINDPTAVAHILAQNESNYTKVGGGFQRVEHYLGPGLITNSGEAWQTMRHQVQREFYYKNITQFLDPVVSTTENLLNDWTLRAGETVNIVSEMTKHVLAITGLTLFGADIHRYTPEVVKQIRAANWYVINGYFLNSRITTPKKRNYLQGRQLLDDMIREMLNPPHTQHEHMEPALRCLRNQPEDSPEEQDRHLYEAKNFLIAGHETTAASLTWALYLLSKHPAILEELLHEIDTVLNGNAPSLEDLDKLELTTMVIEEALRLYPPIWILDRVAIADDVISNYHVPANSVVVIGTYTLHRHPKYWTDPETFNPYRFRKNNPNRHTKYAYIPFNIGPRVCIGKHLALLMMKTILPMILQRFKLTIDPKLDVGVEPLVTLKPDIPIPFKLVPRSSP